MTAYRRVAGCDLGKATARFVVMSLDANGNEQIESTQITPHLGQPMVVFSKWYRENSVAGCSALAATGLYADELVSSYVERLPEDVCLETALRFRKDLVGPLNLISIGARGYSVLSRNERGEIRTSANDKCSSGTGETMVKIAGRFGLSIEAADDLAQTATDSIPITARCSVFAKSEMTHFGNQGKPANQLFAGYFDSIARYAVALLKRIMVDGPVLVIGGGSQLQTLVSAIGDAVPNDVVVPDQFSLFEALGASLLAAEQAARGDEQLPDDPEALIQPSEHRFRILPAASQFRDRVQRMVPPEIPEGAQNQPTILGLDLGSTGSKAVLTAIGTGEIVWDDYDPTRGNPVQAATRLVSALLDGTSPDVRAIGVTGSGREAVAAVLRASFPEIEDRITVLNEIVAHGTAAIHCDERDGENLSVVEIGGQDAKFIQIRGGQIVESDMNKACSAGTGSFLEEQSVFYGVDDIAEFTTLAQRSEGPPDLGQMCTVFVAQAATVAESEGFTTPELFGGFQYSVIHNYINRVMGARKFGERIFFQGKPATGASLAWTLAAVADRDVVVPPNPGAMGAWGIGLCAIRELGEKTLMAASPFDVRRLLDAHIVETQEFQCKDARCGTLCTIERTTVEVSGTKQKVLSGGACPKFELAKVGLEKLPKTAPSAIDQREELLAPYLAETPGKTVVGIPYVGALHGYLPWLTTLIRELGFGVRVLRSDPSTLTKGEERCFSYDSCAPAKVAHGVFDESVDLLFFPKILDADDPDGNGGKTCPVEIAMPEVVEQSLRARGVQTPMLRPKLSFRSGLSNPTLLVAMTALREKLGVSAGALTHAIRAAATAQRSVRSGLAQIGRETLAYGAKHDVPVVVVVGELHVIGDRITNAGIPAILKQNGVLALPMDCFPIPSHIPPLPKMVWADANRALRVAVAARERGYVFPLLLSSFGCGPASFLEHLFGYLMQGYPHTALESDGHGGAAGYVTRIQAFLHTVRQHDRRPAPASTKRLGLLNGSSDPPIDQERDSKLVFLSVGDRMSSLMAAFYRSYGFDAESSGPTNRKALAYGRQDCSGKECLPYQLIWGSFREELEKQPPKKRTVLVQVHGEGMCRNCMFSMKDQISLEEHGLADTVAVRHVRPEPGYQGPFLSKFWTAVVAWDVLSQFAGYYRPLETTAGEVDALYQHYADRLEALLEEPTPAGKGGLVSQALFIRRVTVLVQRAAAAFSRFRPTAAQRREMRTVFVAGDIYLRVDEFGSDQLVRRLNERGLHVIIDPLCALGEYLVQERSPELLGLPTGLIESSTTKLVMSGIRRQLFKAARAQHPWLPMPDGRVVVKRSKQLLDQYPVGEAPATIGSVLHSWDQRTCDGFVVVGPWGCGPALVSEGLLRHQSEIPMLFLYCDGTPIDERKLDGFAFQLRRSAQRVPQYDG
jgi:activator of 2-hydroxyglutaryl-CoA dehydratase/predicted nucleotide-binding protein (sugar kinase/HSP70/actin superfamily)